VERVGHYSYPFNAFPLEGEPKRSGKSALWREISWKLLVGGQSFAYQRQSEIVDEINVNCGFKNQKNVYKF